MHSQLQIRKATSEDIPTIQAIANGTWPTAYGDLLSKEQLSYMLHLMYSHNSLQQQIDKGHQFYMADLDGTPHGFASVSAEGNGKYKLNKLYVLPGTQKTGAGKALLQQVISYAKANNANTLFLQVKRDNIAKGFYEHQGFVITGEIDLDIGNGYFMNDYIMELDLSTPGL